MDKVKTEVHLKWWPSLQDYNEAIQNPHVNLQDAELKSGEPYTTPLGLPRAVTGSFASVYRMHCSNKDYALRLFLKNIEDQSVRYSRISDFVQNDRLPYTVTFNFLKNGIKIRGEWLPALKMEWLEGEAFDEYIIQNLSQPRKLNDLSKKFLKMMHEMKKAGIAHGDLQHGNIIICDKEIRLVDYDGMYVPAMKGFAASECGHRNYQHPARSANHFGPYLDNFSAWIIYASIRALEVDPSLLDQLGGADDCLLFRQTDFTDPLKSPAFAAFEKHKDSELNLLGRFIRAQLERDLPSIPYLEWPIPRKELPNIQPLCDSAQNTRSGPRLVRTSTSEWLEMNNVEAISKQSANAGVKSGQEKKAKSPDIVYAKPAQSSTWVKPSAKASASASNSAIDASATAGGVAVKDLPEELAITHTPRKTAFDGRKIALGRFAPSTYQFWMVLNPFVWTMLFTLFALCTTDKEFCEHAVAYPAIVHNINFYKHTYKGTTTSLADISFMYKVNGQNYFIDKEGVADLTDYDIGKAFPVWALPSNPLKHLPIGHSPIVKQRDDLIAAWFYIFVNGFLEYCIWFTPLLHRRLARVGVPVWAMVENIQEGSREDNYIVKLSYEYRGKNFSKTIGLNKSDMRSINWGKRELALCDPMFPKNVALYKLCLYRPTIAGP